MTSLELKPQNDINRCYAVEELQMTYPRNKVPLHLASRVSLSLWQETWDAVQARFEHEFRLVEDFRSSTLPFFFCPCCIPCLLCVFNNAHEKELESEHAWVILCSQQNEKYEKLKITVTLINEVYAAGVGSARRFDRRNVGLKFDVHPYSDAGGGGDPLLAGAVATTDGAGTSSLAQDLKAVETLYQRGVLTEEEFRKAKAKLLG